MSRWNPHGCGKPPTPEYRAWLDMRQRCINPKYKQYADYGGRGILICPEWNDFPTFLMEIGMRPSAKHSLDRIDNNGNYCQDNCKWSLRPEQQLNRRNTIYVQFQGSVCKLMDLCNLRNVRYNLVKERVKLGWEIERALTLPVVRGRRRGASTYR